MGCSDRSFVECTNGLFPLPDLDSDSDSDTNSHTMQDFSTVSDLDSDPLIEMYVIGTEICFWDRDTSLKGYSTHLGKGSGSESESGENVLHNTM